MVKVRPAVVRVPVKSACEKYEMRESKRKKDSILVPAILLSWEVCSHCANFGLLLHFIRNIQRPVEPCHHHYTSQWPQ